MRYRLLDFFKCFVLWRQTQDNTANAQCPNKLVFARLLAAQVRRWHHAERQAQLELRLQRNERGIRGNERENAGGSFRVGISARLRLQAIAAYIIVASGASKANATIHDFGFARVAGV